MQSQQKTQSFCEKRVYQQRAETITSALHAARQASLRPSSSPSRFRLSLARRRFARGGRKEIQREVPRSRRRLQCPLHEGPAKAVDVLQLRRICCSVLEARYIVGHLHGELSGLSLVFHRASRRVWTVDEHVSDCKHERLPIRKKHHVCEMHVAFFLGALPFMDAMPLHA